MPEHYRHIAQICEYLRVRKFDETAQVALAAAVRQAALLREDLVDIINIVIEELVRCRYEAPSFPVLREEAKKSRAAVSRDFFERVSRALGKERCRTIDRLLEAGGIDKRSLWQSLKADAGAPTLKQIRFWTKRLSWLKSLDLHTAHFFAGVPALRVRSFALEVRSLEAARVIEMEPHKRYTVAAALVRWQIARCLDDLGEMLINRAPRRSKTTRYWGCSGSSQRPHFGYKIHDEICENLIDALRSIRKAATPDLEQCADSQELRVRTTRLG